MRDQVFFFLIFLLAFNFSLIAQSVDKLKYGYKTTTSIPGVLRDKPSLNGATLIEIPKGERISVFNNFQNPYFYVIYGDKAGYLSYSSIVLDETLKTFIDSNSEKRNTSNYTEKSNNNSKNQNAKSSTYSTKKSKVYQRGPRGGCYYINSQGNKVYVDRSLCN